ncbi:extracellular protein, partial [Geopyxis carbonaria]
MQITNTLLLAVLAVGANAHARIKYPPPLGAPVDGPAGNAYNAPLAADGSQFPCKGLHTAATTDKKPTATWAAGSGAHFEILGHGAGGGEGSLAAHSGGSCQASLSYDTGKTWKVLHSFEGGCPRGVALGSNMAMSANQTFPFEIPADAKAAKDALFAWTWTAVSGNRDEYYMNCAAVEITGSGTSTLDELPDMWVGDQRIPGVIKEGECASTAGSALKYPNPGEKVTK